MTNPDKTPDQEPVEDIIAEQAAAKREDEGGDANASSDQSGDANDLSSASLREQLEAAIAERDENKDMLLRGQA